MHRRSSNPLPHSASRIPHFPPSLPHCLLALLPLLLASCQTLPQSGTRAETLPTTPPTYRLANDTVEVIIDPSIGRITRYAPLHGQNILWQNTPDGLPIGTWPNHGGEKTWLWPQNISGGTDGWKTHTGKSWPPPADDGRTTFTATLHPHSVELTSTPVPGYNVIIHKRITLAPHNSTLTTETWLEPAPLSPQSSVLSPNLPPPAIWIVTQIPAPQTIVITQLDTNSLTSPRGLNATLLDNSPPWPTSITQTHATLIPPDSAPAKIALNADQLTAVIPGYTFTQRATWHRTDDALFDSQKRLQLYAEPQVDPHRLPTLPRYVELEFIAAQHLGRDYSLTITWTLTPVPTKP